LSTQAIEGVRMDEREFFDVLSAKLKSGAINRRQFLRAASVFGFSSAASLYLAACGPAPAAAPTAAPTSPPAKPTEAPKPAPTAPLAPTAAPKPPTAAPATAAPAAKPVAAAPFGSVRFLVAESFWANWHPYQHTAQIQGRLQRQVFDRLVEFETDDFSKLSPGLAREWRQIDDTTWEFKLQQSVKFHNGQNLTAEDVKASIELASGATPEQVAIAARFVPTTVELVSPDTVRLKTKTPFGPLLNQLAGTDIISAADIQAGAETLKAKPNGTGPFRVTGDEKDKKSMEAFTDYWRGSPKIKTLVWEFIQDPQTRLNALLGGQAQVIDRVPPEHVEVIRRNAQLTLTSKTGFENVNLWMRQDAPPPWNPENVKLKEAVAWSIDREALVKNLVGGSSQVARSHIPNLAAFFVEQKPAYTFDPDKAKAALKEAGFPDGIEFPLHATTGFLPRSKEVVESIVDSMEKVGLRAKPVFSDVAGIIDVLFSKDKGGVMFHLSWSSSGDPHTALNQLYHSPGAWAGASDKTLDEMLDKGAAATKNEDRAKIYAEVQAYLWKRLPHIPLYNSDFTVAHTKALTEVRVLPNFNTYFFPAALSA
jgi:peptide/nickel transport system substrate-binding protein